MTTRTLEIEVNQSGDAQDGLDSIIDSLSSGFSTAATVAAGALAGITAVVVGIGAAAANAWSAMDEGVDNFTNRTGVTGDALDAVQESIEKISESSAGVGQSLGDIGDVMGVLQTRTNETGKTLDDMTEGMLKLSRVTGEDAVEGSELFTRVLGDWSIEAKDSVDLLDKLTTAHQKSGISVNDLMQKVVQFGAPLRQMGFGVEESISLFSKWEKEGVNAELVMGSLRIAAGHFAKEQKKANETQIGGVKSMAEAQDKLVRLKDQLIVATLRQSEFNEKTKESTIVQSQMRIDDLTKDIQELESAMAQGEIRTVTTTGAQKSLKESLQETFDAIKNASSETEALSLAMNVFGARAGPDMAAAIREGRFSIEEYMTALDGADGALDKTSEATLDFGDRFGLMQQKVLNSLVPVGQAIMDLGDIGLQFAGPMVDSLTGWIDKVAARYEEGGIAGVTEMVKADLALLGNSINAQVQIWSQEFWKWLDDVVAKAPANFALLQNTVQTQLVFLQTDIENAVATYGPTFVGWIDDSRTFIDEKMSAWANDFNVWVKNNPEVFREAGRDAGTAVVEGVVTLFTSDGPKKSVTDSFAEAVVAPLKNVLSAIDTAILEFTVGIVSAIVQGIMGQSGEINTGLENTIRQAIMDYSPSNFFYPVGKRSAEEITSGLVDQQSSVSAAATGVMTNSRGSANNEARSFEMVGHTASDGVVKGINDGVPKIERAARRAAERAYNAAMDELEANSPSQLFADDVGDEAIMGGIALGINQGISTVSNAMSNAIGQVSSDASKNAGTGGNQGNASTPVKIPNSGNSDYKPVFATGTSNASGPSSISVNLNYAPVLSTSDAFEVETILAPMIAKSVRNYFASNLKPSGGE